MINRFFLYFVVNIFVFTMLIAGKAAAQSSCNNPEVIERYVQEIHEVVDWGREEEERLAVLLCQEDEAITGVRLEQQTLLNQIISEDGEFSNLRICGDLGIRVFNDNGDIIQSALTDCRQAFSASFVGFMDVCYAQVGIGYNPHNVGILFFDRFMTKTCEQSKLRLLQIRTEQVD